MANIGEVWDDTTRLLGARAHRIAPFAAFALFLPPAVHAGLVAAGPAVVGAMGVGLLVMVFAVVKLWGRMAITAIALRPDDSARAAAVLALRRLLPMIGALLVLAAAGTVLVAPIVYVLSAAGFDWNAAAMGVPPAVPPLTRGNLWFVTLYALLLAALALWVLVRVKLLLGPVVLAERRVIGAIGRAVQLSRGMTWRLIGTVLLYYIVVLVGVQAATWVTGTILRLAAPAASLATVTLIATLVGAVVGVLLDVVAQVFTGRLYVALAGDRREDGVPA